MSAKSSSCEWILLYCHSSEVPICLNSLSGMGSVARRRMQLIACPVHCAAQHLYIFFGIPGVLDLWIAFESCAAIRAGDKIPCNGPLWIDRPFPSASACIYHSATEL